MKKSLISSPFYSSILCTAFAQKNKSISKKNNMEYGFLSSANFNTIRKNNVNIFLKQNLTNYAGISVGGYFKVNINPSFGIKVLAQYDQNGYRLDGLSFEIGNGTGIALGNATIKTTYLNVPVAGEFTFGNKIKYYINTGPYVGFLLNSNVISKISSIANSTASTTKTKSDGHKRTNFGVAVGTGTLIPISKKCHCLLV